MQTFRAVFLAEVRTTRRLARTWVLSVLAVATTLVGYLYFSALHGEMSSFLPSAVTSPRFLIASFGGYLLWFLMAAAVFLGFDIGIRERRERIADAFDTRPVSNLQLLAGRLAGVVATLAVPIAVAVTLIQGIGLVGQSFDWPIRAIVEPVSLAAFLALDALPAMVLWIAMVFVLAAVLRSRLAVAVVAFALLGAAIWSLSLAPAWLLQTVALAPDRLVSDLVTPVPEAATLLHRLSLVVTAAGVVVLAALCLPRPDDLPRLQSVAAAIGLIGAGALGIGTAIAEAHAELDRRTQWRTAQESATGSVVDVASLTGEVTIDPGVALYIDVTLTVSVPDTASTDLVLPFNPGMATREVLLDGRSAQFKHRDGLLRVGLPAMAGDTVDLTVRADGIPDADYAYLDSAIDYRTVVGANPLRGLGTEGSLFARRYVALMPGVHWLPGVAAKARSSRDFANVDLVVQTPEGWLVAGLGDREDLGEGRYRFTPSAPVAQVGFVASDFERFATSVDGIELELLLSPRHTAPVRFFEDSATDIAEALANILDEAKTLGLPYPYGALSLVEVPAPLRGYGGGWEMPSVMALPGLLLLRERGFPTARFYDSAVPTRFPTAKLDRLRKFLGEDRSGADPFAGLARNLLLHQTGAHGPGAAAVEYVCQALVAHLLDDPEGYFSAHIYASSPSVSTLLADAFTSALIGGSGSASGDIFAAVRPPSVWERALGMALSEIDDTDPAHAVNILTLKGDAVAHSLFDHLGRDVVAGLVADLRARYRGASFSATDFERVATEVGAEVRGVLGDWLYDSSLPGFVASTVTTERLADDDQGEPRHQLRVHVFNGEDTPGLLRLRYRLPGDDSPLAESDPVRVPGRAAMEIGLVTPRPIRELWVAPYLSLNRQEFPLRVPETETAHIVETAPFVAARPSPWRPVAGSGIVVDDLDPGFSATAAAYRNSSNTRPQYDVDEGLPVYQRLDPALEANWSRQEQPTSWGRYRHTIARVTPGDGDRAAAFSTTLPRPGRWRVDYHLPNLAARYTARSRSTFNLTADVEFDSGNRGPLLANYDMKLLAGDDVHDIEFDASAAEPGWTTLGRFDLGAGKVSLVVTNRTDGRTVVADAVRWVLDDSSAGPRQ